VPKSKNARGTIWGPFYFGTELFFFGAGVPTGTG
jgi:hypothetical protein